MTVFCIGEAMGEIAMPDGLPPQIAVGGDVFNTAVYLSHLGVKTAFVSALGDDPFGQDIRRALERHRVDARHVVQGEGGTGIYTICTDSAGERSFHYWRNEAPARRMLVGRDLVALAQSIGQGVLYLSGITLWVLRENLATLCALLDLVHGQGGKIVFDGNFRPRLWGNERRMPQDAARAVQARADLALLTFEDEVALWNDDAAETTLARVMADGCPSVVVKRGGDACVYASGDAHGSVPVPEIIQPVDTTAAGDSFNAGFLAHWLRKPAELRDAVLAGHRLAGLVIRHHGALLPDETLQTFLTAKLVPSS